MIPSLLPEQALSELGRTEGGPDTLALLVRDQQMRRLLLLRAVLDAVEEADAEICPPVLRQRFRSDWALLEEADRAGEAEEPPGEGKGVRHSPARTQILYPLVGPWARGCLRALSTKTIPRTARQRRARSLRRELCYFSALAAAAAVRAGVSFSARLSAQDGMLALPSLGALGALGAIGDGDVEVVARDGRMTLRRRGEADVVVVVAEREAPTAFGTGLGPAPGAGFATWSAATAWKPVQLLPGLLPESVPVPLDDLDPHRTVDGGSRHQALSGPATLDEAARERWLTSWTGVRSILRLGGEHRVAEVATLLRCLVPLAPPAGHAAPDGGTGSCSGTRREAFGAVLSSTPPTPATFAATLVHEMQHAKLAALSDMVVLHREGAQERYFAPWRPDPRPYDGLLQGAYSHVALADFFQRCALAATVRPEQRSIAWGEHARYRAQVRMTLPVLAASTALTAQGRLLVARLTEECERMGEEPPPPGMQIRAEERVSSAHARWFRCRTPAE
ncbi:HEXXH motif-containing putative peptide modification protein [Streptomyces sp. LRE541]|uniref:aKG-HExxH-type peptide beta-hydroxylase n=1 Tax=Streptomyces sp. LRE541 TaxID=2931983 RepID=UPI00200BC41C|nr:HEXXH motif-containing putative peptide modification protein [Streptomyces sp. LRE541]UPZ28985.1 HEXXH motif-containing putative peptide modification protein [Streptomyces sp. LRE541]